MTQPVLREKRRLRLMGLVSGLILIFLTAPMAVLLLQSFTADTYLQFPPRNFGLRWYDYVLEDPKWREAGLRSLFVAAVVSPVAVVIGTLAALGIDRGPARGRAAMYAILISPMVLPHLVLALGMLRLALSVGIEDTNLALVLGHLTIAVPYVVITVGASIRGLDRTLEEAARSLGATTWSVFFHVILPGIRSGIVAGAIFAFIASFDEFIVSYFLVTYRFTLPLQIFSTLSFELSPSIAAASSLALMLSALLTALVIARGQIVAGGSVIR